MKHLKTAVLLAAVALAGPVLAHGDVKNPVVKMRHAAMKAIADNTKVLGEMAKGALPFDAAKAQEAAVAIAAQAAMTPALFEDPSNTDPKSEALPAIWDDFADFTAKSDALVAAAEGLDTSSLDGVRAGLGQIGGACKACHSKYRE